jgi:hypothetical protein
MDDVRRDAGEATQRPRAPAGPEVADRRAARPAAIRRAVGLAPVLDPECARLVPRSEPARGMISNPWVKQWTAGAAAAAAASPAAPEVQERPRHEPRDAGPAPHATPPDES